jgi:Ribosomal L37ae protein family
MPFCCGKDSVKRGCVGIWKYEACHKTVLNGYAKMGMHETIRHTEHLLQIMLAISLKRTVVEIANRTLCVVHLRSGCIHMIQSSQERRFFRL